MKIHSNLDQSELKYGKILEFNQLSTNQKLFFSKKWLVLKKKKPSKCKAENLAKHDKYLQSKSWFETSAPSNPRAKCV